MSATFANNFFNSSFYLQNNVDVVGAIARGQFSSAQQHFQQFGRFENRSPNASWNATQYLINNPDVANAVGSRAIQSAWDHFVTFGAVEGRSSGTFTGTFNSAAYLAANPDVQAAVTAGGFRSAYEHFVLFGAAEGRAAVNTAGASITTQPGSTFTLTTGTDAITGTSGNDIIVGDFATTAQGSDQINGGTGVDTLRLFGTYDAAKVGAITGVETVNLVNAVANASLNLSTVFTSAGTGTTSIILNDVSLLNDTITVGAGQTLSLATAGNIVTAGAVAVNHSATDTTSSLVLNGYQGVSGGTPFALTTTGAATTTYNLTSQGAANAVLTLTGPATATTVNIIATTALNVSTSLVATAATTVNISGAGNVTIAGSDLAATVAVNASTATGNVGYTAEAGGSTLTFTGGSGNDSVSFAAATLTIADKLTGGLGTDTIVINDKDPVYAAINASTGFEVVRFATNLGILDVAQVTNGINSFAVGAGDLTETFTNALSTSTFSINDTANNSGNITIANKTGEFATTVTVDDGTLTIVRTLATLTLTGSNVINLVSAGTGTGGGNVITDTVTADNVRFNISGGSNLTIANAIDGAGVGTTVDASTFTGKLSLTGTSFNDVITGGSGADTLSGGAGVDTIVGNAGADAIKGNAGADVLTGGAGNDTFRYELATENQAGDGSNVDRILDFTAGADKITFVVTGHGDILGAVLNNITFKAALDKNLFATVNAALTSSATVNSIANVLTDLGTVLANSTTFAASATDGAATVARVVTYSAGTAAGTYLVVNDAEMGFQASHDLVINITGLTGTVAASDFSFV